MLPLWKNKIKQNVEITLGPSLAPVLAISEVTRRNLDRSSNPVSEYPQATSPALLQTCFTSLSIPGLPQRNTLLSLVGGGGGYVYSS